MCFVDMEKAFDITLGNLMEQMVGKKVLPDVLVTGEMCLYEEARMRVIVDFAWSEELEVEVDL